MDVSVSVPCCKRGLRGLYAVANSNRSAPPSISPLLAENGTLNFTLLCVGLCVSSDKEPGVVSGPVGARGPQRLLVCDQDELALGETGVEERAEPLPQVLCILQGPLRIGPVRLDVGLMVGFTDFVKQAFELAGEIHLHHPYLLHTT